MPLTKEAEACRARRRKERTRKWRTAYKNRPCADCGHRFPAPCMEFDHVRGNKRFELGTAVGSGRVSIKALDDEAAKCDLVCANCHRIRTIERKQHKKGVENKRGTAFMAWYSKKRDNLSALKGTVCKDCAKNYPSCALEFHHVVGEKLFNIGNSLHRSWTSLVAEINKCEVVCACCHRMRTYTNPNLGALRQGASPRR